MHFFQRLPLARKHLLGIVPLFLLFIAVSVTLQNHFQEQEMMEQAQISAHTYAEIVRESLFSMMVNNLEVDSSFLERVNALQQFDTLHILVQNLRLRKELMTPQRIQRLEVKYRVLQPRDDIERKALASGRPIFTREGDHFRGVIPFNATPICQKCHAVPVGYTLGATDLHISLASISRVAEGNWKRSSLIFLIFAVLVITVATVMFARFVSTPVYRLVAATNEISKGNLEYSMQDAVPSSDPAVLTVGAQDELAFLAFRFDEMRRSLKEKIDQLDHANRALSERNEEVEEALKRLGRAQEDLVRSERLAVTGKLTAQLSHEINNPIHNIQSLLESSLRRISSNDQARELVGVALEEVSRMAKLTRQMLDVYRGSVVETEQDIIDVGDVLAEVVKMYKGPLAKQHIDIALQVRPALTHVRGSRDKLKQVMLNLIINARDAMPQGGSITLKVEALHGHVRIDVIDTGIGIPPEHISRIFDAFFTTKKEVSGVGLGLSVSYGIIQQHKGTIAVTNTGRKGTTFTIQLPTEGVDHG